MNRTLSLSALGVLLLASGEARPCGGAFGNTVTLDPVQQIVVAYRNGVETYILNPYFCGNSDTFGLILPVPGILTQNPTLGQKELYTDLGKLAAPNIQTQTVCGTNGTGGAAWAGSGGKSAGTGGGPGTTVIDRGQVGIFDWVLLQATSTKSFTDWLTANGFQYQSSAALAFNAYVGNGWYFVAFKVSTGTSGTGGAGGGGSGGSGAIATGGNGAITRICGNFGPVMLSFASATQLIVPARIAAVSSNQLNWTLFTVAAQQMRLKDYTAALHFSGPVGDAELASYPNLTPLSQSGDRVTELLVSLPASTVTDLVLEPDPNQADFRSTEYRTVYVNCTGGSPGTGGTGSTTGGSHNTGGSVPLGGLFNNGGTSNIGGAESSGGLSATGGMIVIMTGGSPNTGGLSATGGVIVAPTGGAPGAGGLESSGGAKSTGGAANIGGTTTATNHDSANNRDDGGCAVRANASGSPKSGESLLAAILGFVALYGRRRRKN